MRTSRSVPARRTSVGRVNEDGALTGVTGAVAQLGDPAEAQRLGAHLAGDPRVRAVAVHTDRSDDHWALVRATGDPDIIVDACRSTTGAAVAEIRSRRLRRHRVQWSTGDPTPGVSMVFDVARHPDLSTADFHRHWRDVHGPKALKHHIGMWDYDQLSLIGGGAIDLDGIAVVSFPTLDDATHRFFDTDEGAEIIRADAAFFTDAATLGRRMTTEWIVKDDPDPASESGARQNWTDHRSLDIPAPVADVWDVLGDFGALLDWWPAGLVALRVDDGPPTTRTLERADGSTVIEQLVHHRPAERMFQLTITHGLADTVADYRCRYELRDTAAGCRLDWSPQASVSVGAEQVFAAIVDGGWGQVSEGLTNRFGA